MKNFKIVLLWTYAIVLCLTIYTFGQSTYYCYQNNDGLGLKYKSYRGETIIKMWNLYDREKCNYVGTRKIFDKQPKARQSSILIILGLSTFSACRINRKGKKGKSPFYTVPSRETTLSCAEGKLSDPITTGQPAPQERLSQDKESFFDLGAALEDDLITEASEFQHMDRTEGNDGKGMPGFEEIFNEIQQTQLASEDRNEPLFHYNLGSAYQKIGPIDEATEELIKALWDPKRTDECYLRLAGCAREQNMFSEGTKLSQKRFRAQGPCTG